MLGPLTQPDVLAAPITELCSVAAHVLIDIQMPKKIRTDKIKTFFFLSNSTWDPTSIEPGACRDQLQAAGTHSTHRRRSSVGIFLPCGELSFHAPQPRRSACSLPVSERDQGIQSEKNGSPEPTRFEEQFRTLSFFSK